ncbi:WD40 repeat-like protein [Coprinopsis marcescibilis]|uniref:WD40 repeat-like protein n=1 Tax=Coprinopsis marcescibilis TaxID=230819 RepID=A0A5C3KGY1_COPMA|nr:WD40 repeat-like protein [Coprinopsis marcescibilis]
MSQPKGRVSYIIPPSTGHVRRFQLPPHGSQRLGAVAPILVPHLVQTVHNVDETPSWARHPRHRLGVAALAIDSSTFLAGRSSPEGILYSGGRDGLIIARDLGVRMKKRTNQSVVRPKDRWEMITGWADDAIEEETDESDERGTDGDVLGEVTGKRQRAASVSQDLPIENQWETDMNSFRPGVHSEFRQSAQAHSDWINDLLLCNYNQTVISASSDGTVKAWSPHSATPTDPAVIGSHADYVRCLALCREKNWVASGSFDRTIKLWDLSRTTQADALTTLNPPDATAPKSSVYAVASDPFGRTIASGSPERVVRLWDPRTGKRTGKLVGHTDNIRAILISEDSRYLLTGSADATVKLWSLGSQRCLHTFTHHADSVWSLYSTNPNLETFYSGDRTGLVCRVDLEDCTDLSEGECLLLCNESGESGHASEGITRIAVMDDNLLWTASGSSTIQRWHIPQPRTTRNFAIPDPDGEATSSLSLASPPIKRRLQFQTSGVASEASTRPSTGQGQPRRMSSAPSVQSLFSEHIRKRGMSFDNMINGIPLDHHIKLISPNDPFASFTHNRSMKDAEVATLYSAASVVSVPTSRVPQPHNSPIQSSRTEETVMPTSVARADYEERELASDAIPYCTQPDDILKGEHGLVRSVILNDRIHALTVDIAGEVAVWDIVRGVCLGSYHPEDVAAASQPGSVSSGVAAGKERSPREALEAVRERIEGEGVANTWCTADTKAGVLTIHMTERCFETEVYADEVGFSHDKHFNEESKLNVGKWVLRNLFQGFIKEEVHLHKKQGSAGSGKEMMLPPSISRGDPPSPESTRKLRHRYTSSSDSPRKSSRYVPMSSTVVCSPKMIPVAAPTSINTLPRSSPLLSPMIPLHPPKDHITQSPILGQDQGLPLPLHQRTRSGTMDGSMNRTPSSGPAKEDYFSIRTRQPSTHGGDDTPMPTAKTEPATPGTPSGGLMGRLKILGKMGKRPVSESASPVLGAATPTLGALSSSEDTPIIEFIKTPMQQLLSGSLTPPSTVDAPHHNFPSQTVVLISEEATPSYRTLYRGHVVNTHHDTGLLEDSMPMWLAEYLLLNKLPPMPPTIKLSFVLLPWNKDPDVEPLPELLNSTQSKLTASKYLRVSKILMHVQDKLDKLQHQSASVSRAGSIRSSVEEQHALDPQMSPRLRADDLYEVLCNEAVLPLDMTLAAVRQYVWRNSSELVMHYRRRHPNRVAEELGFEVL